MSENTPLKIEDRLDALLARWQGYLASGGFEQFVEFTVALNSLAEQLARLRLPGLMRLCEGLETAALSLFGGPESHPLPAEQMTALQRQIDTLSGSMALARRPQDERRQEPEPRLAPEAEWVKPRAVWIVTADNRRELAAGLVQQLRYYGFRPVESGWGSTPQDEEQPLAVLCLPHSPVPDAATLTQIAELRQACQAGQLLYLGAPDGMESIVSLMRAGIDVAVPEDEQSSMVLNRILDLVQTREQDRYRVLVVEDSRVAVALIQRTLAAHNIDSLAIADPATLLDALKTYRPDLILMDMYMPNFTGVEATRVLRQMGAFQSIPIVYLSSESDIGMQVEALRLGGDQFLTKPFNPVVLAAVVKTKIERYRETLRSSRLDGLTGLYNHTASKARLKRLIEELSPHGNLCVAMIDIDHFKAVNDTYGHPVGDQVIRGLAWLLKGRLRETDLVGRYGGEEFIIALPDIEPPQVHAVIERIRRDFARLPHTHPGGSLYTSFSAGVACVGHHPNATAVTAAADNALLQAKANGRNRIEFACCEGADCTAG